MILIYWDYSFYYLLFNDQAHEVKWVIPDHFESDLKVLL